MHQLLLQSASSRAHVQIMSQVVNSPDFLAFTMQMVYPNTNQACTYMPNSMNVNANSVMVPPGFAQTDSTVSTPSVPSKNTTTTAVDSSYLEKQHPVRTVELY